MGLLLALSAFGDGASAHEAVRLESIDPLALPAPRGLGELVLPEDSRRVEEKVVPALWARAVAAPDDESLAVIVTLHEPLERDGADAAPEAREARRVARVAAVEHRFAEKARALGLTEARGLSHFPIVIGRIAPGRLAELAGLGEVFAIQEDQVVKAFRTEGSALIKAGQLRTQFGGTGAGIGVAVIDSGVQATHPELNTRVLVEGDYTNTTGNGAIDDNGHGTAVAGIIAGTSGGMAPQANIWALKVLNAQGMGNTSLTLAALNDAFANRNNFGALHHLVWVAVTS